MGQIHVLKMNLKRLTRFCLVQKPLCRSCVHGASYTQSVPTSTMHELPVFQTWPPAKPSEGKPFAATNRSPSFHCPHLSDVRSSPLLYKKSKESSHNKPWVSTQTHYS